MWSNFFLQEENRRRSAAARRRARGQPKAQMTPEREGKIKLALLLTSVGATLAVLAVGTEFWVELNTYRDNGSAVCDAAHLGLWKMCTKRLWQADVPAGRDTCGPAELPGEEDRVSPNHYRRHPCPLLHCMKHLLLLAAAESGFTAPARIRHALLLPSKYQKQIALILNSSPLERMHTSSKEPQRKACWSSSAWRSSGIPCEP